MKVFIGPYNRPDPETGEYEENFVRNVEIEIHDYDSWDAFTTLAQVILPVLRQYRETSSSIFSVNQDDLPEGRVYDDWSPGNYSHGAWLWVVNEIIWTMGQIAEDADHEYTAKLSWDERKAYYDRRQRGCELFGKYFQNLWD